MGMFDNINFEMKCPICKKKVTGFQSKDGVCLLKTLEFWEVDNFYATCMSCDTWIEFNRKIPRKKESIKNFKMKIEKKEKGE